MQFGSERRKVWSYHDHFYDIKRRNEKEKYSEGGENFSISSAR
jgi:hypothetical protein